MKVTKLVLALAVLFAFGAVASFADDCGVSGNLVVNCGFETGDTTGWVTPDGSTASVGMYSGSPYAHSGNYAVGFGSVVPTNPNTLGQSISTIAGHDYTIDFWLKLGGDCSSRSNCNSFTATFGGTTIYSSGDEAPFPYKEVTASVVATSSSTELRFSGFSIPSYYWLDDVSVVDNGVVGTPEPSSLCLFCAGLLGGLGMIRRKYQK